MSHSTYTKPALKWVGGKTQILETLFENFPKKINDYHEIFVGGGSVLLALLDKINNNEIELNGTIYAYDLNQNLIGLYNNIKNEPNELNNELKKIKNEHNSITGNNVNRKAQNKDEALTSKESHYYWIRSLYNQMTNYERTTLLGSAYFIFLNKTCFRGLYRIGPNGFNVPYGNYKNPDIYNETHILLLSKMFEKVHFINSDFNKSLSEIIKNKNKKDFVYMDPPYVPETKNAFVSYNLEDFNSATHKQLFKLCKQLKKTRINFLLSNSNTQMLYDFFDENEYALKKITCKRNINSKEPNAKTYELLIYPNELKV